ncbi:MAG: hypothetical protein OXD54_07360 [Candidatus Poribacteria bacterium]|nr:hypothetical protein [Candidatus Poribacteria bacterium]
MKQNPEQKVNILTEINNKKIVPVYLLCGKETFLIEGTLKQMVEKLLPPDTRDFNLTYLDGNSVSVQDILSNVELYPIMSECRVVVVENFPGFNARTRKTSPLTAIQDAMKLESDDVQKCVSDIAKLLSVSIQQIADGESDYNSAVDEINESLGGRMNEDVSRFFSRLPQLASQHDTITESGSNNGDADLLLEWLEGDLPKTSVLIFIIKDEVNQNNKIAKAIQKVGKYVSFDPLEKGTSLNRDPLYRKVIEKFATYNKKITPRAFEQLRNRTGGDMHTIAEAINKIINYVGDKQQIDETDVRNMVTQTDVDNMFGLTDALGKRSTRLGIKSLREVLASGTSPHLVVGAITSHLRLTLQAKLIAVKKRYKPIGRQMRFENFTQNILQPLSEEMGDILPKTTEYNILKRHPFPVFKIFQSLHTYTMDELLLAIDKTLEVQIQLKTTNVDDGLLLEQLVYDICSGSKSRWK